MDKRRRWLINFLNKGDGMKLESFILTTKNRSLLRWVNELCFTLEAVILHWHQSPHLFKWEGWTRWSLRSLPALKVLWICDYLMFFSVAGGFAFLYVGTKGTFNLENLNFVCITSCISKERKKWRYLSKRNWSLIYFRPCIITYYCTITCSKLIQR